MSTLDYFRVSTIARLVEDGVVAGVKAVGRGASSAGRSIKSGAHAVQVEYRARMVLKAAEYATKQFEEFERMTPEQLAAVERDMAEVAVRAQQIAEERDAKAARRASRAGS